MKFLKFNCIIDFTFSSKKAFKDTLFLAFGKSENIFSNT